MMQHLTTRKATADDRPFLQALFTDDRSPEYAALDLPAEQLDPLLEMQFRAREQSYAADFPAAVDSILCLEDGTPIGHHLLERRVDSLRTVDLAILPAWRNRRIGGWVLHETQLEAVQLNLPYRLSVRHTNRARHLYARQGFKVVAQDQHSAEMEWTPPADPTHLPAAEVLARVVPFLREIGFAVDFGPVPSDSFLPGIHLIRNGLCIETERLLHPGDLFHEAGHLAVMPPGARLLDSPEPTDGGEELAATAWSYAAAMHLGIPVSQVIHEHGYRGSAASIREVLGAGESFGTPLLAWMRLTDLPLSGQTVVYPKMRCWVRETSPEFQAGSLEPREEAATGTALSFCVTPESRPLTVAIS